MEQAILIESEIFQGIGPGSRTRLADLASSRTVEAGELVFGHGDEADELGIVDHGQIELFLEVKILGVSRPIALERCGRGALVAWSALVPPHRLTLGGRALGPVGIWMFSKVELTSFFEGEPAVGYKVMCNVAAVVGRRFQAMQQMWADEVQRHLNEKYRS
jgi:CRP-like cAMP-binding protein